MMRRLIISFLSVIVVLSSFCQSYDENDFTRYTKLDGLSHNSVTGIVQDSSGYIWISTKKGLNRFDGRSFSNFFKISENLPLPENDILYLTRQQNEIIGSTAVGAFSYNTITRKIRSFTVPADSNIFFWSNQVWHTLKDKAGNYVLSTKTGLYVFNEAGKLVSRYDHFTPQDAGLKELWFGNWLAPLSDGRIFQENNLAGSFYNYKTKTIEAHSFNNHSNLRRLLNSKIDEERISFYGGNDQLITPAPEKDALEFYNLVNGQYASYSIPKHVIPDLDWYSRLFFINDSVAALTSKVGGFYLLQFSTANNYWYCNSEKLFPGKYCTSVFSDRSNRLWVGTNDGLYKQNIRNSFFTNEDLSQQLPSIVNTGIQSIFISQHKIYAGLRNEGGLLILNDQSKKIEQVIDLSKYGPGSNSLNFIFHFSNDTLWLGTAKGILWFNKKNNSHGQLDVPGQPAWFYNTKTRSFLKDSEGDIWLSFGILNSLVLFKRSERRFYDYSKSPLLKITFCFSMEEDKNRNVWIAGDGLCRWNRKKKSIDTLIPYPTVIKTVTNYMRLLDCDNENNLWLASYDNEIIQYNCNENKMYLRVAENSMIDGHSVTSSDIINDHIWLGMANGISAFNIKDHSIKQFNYSDGLPSAVVTSPRNGSFYDADRNRFYFGAGQYLISFVPDARVSEKAIPFFSVEVMGENQTQSNKTVLPYSKNNVELTLNAINFTDPEENRFAYRFLSEKNEIWNELNTKNVVVLGKLPPGSHRIEVKMYSVNNRWPAQTQTIHLQIKPPFWRSPYFLLPALAALLWLVVFMYRKRVKQINRQANIDKQLTQTEMKALHAQMNPHFIFNCLNSIREMILNNENEQASLYLSKFARLIRITLNHSSKQFVSLKDTVDYLERYIEMESIRNNQFTYKIDVAKDLNTDDIMVPPMLIQPFIENAIWHGSAQKKNITIAIRFKQEGNHLICIVEDDGIGIEESLKRKRDITHEPSIGIDNIKQRIELLNEKYNLQCTLEIVDKLTLSQANETGTLVTLHLPIKTNDNLWT
ncbi:histidine kinase [Lacibacter sp. H375]|uniref:sensor histidine kinase n=1 Tax=Lacibacter sp. H375 TaxID=3133424 RepID=UPI0030BE9B65